MDKIRNLCFDLGGVVMDIKRQRCIEAFRALGMERPEEWLGEYAQKGVFAGIEDGSLTPDQFHAELRPYLRPGVTDAQIDDAFMQFLIGIPPHRLAQLRALRQAGYGLYLLSNTNPVMWNAKIADEFRQEGKSGPADYFDGLTTSFECKVMKPDPAIFAAMLHSGGIKGSETLFLDDSEANCEAARRCGIHALHVPQGSEFMELLRTVPDLMYPLP